MLLRETSSLEFTRKTRPALRPLVLATVAALALMAAAPGQAQYYSYSGAVSTWAPNANFPPDPGVASLDLSLTSLAVGNGAAGSFAAMAGAQLMANSLSVGSGPSADGSFGASGAGTLVQLEGSNVNRLDIGNGGGGAVTVSGGALIDASGKPAGCAGPDNSCGNNVGNSAGSSGSLTVTGAGSAVRLLGLNVANVGSGAGWGTPGADSHGTVQLTQGGSLATMQVTLGGGQDAALATGTEKSFSSVLIDGAGSQWISSADTVNNNGAAFTVGAGPRAQSTVTVSNSGKLVLDGTLAPAGLWTSLNIGTGGGQGELDVSSGGSVQTIGALNGISVGSFSSGAGSVGVMKVLSGGQAGAGFINVADGFGATGTLTVSGAGSLVTLDSNTVSSGRMNIGNNGVGTVTVSQGGVIDATSHLDACDTTLSSCSVRVGTTTGSSGTLVITDPGSTVKTGEFHVSAGWVDANFGMPGGTSQGAVQVLAGGLLSTEYAEVATVWGGPAANGMEHAVGSVLVDGAGSQWKVGADTLGQSGATLVVGSGAFAMGTVTVQNGGQLTVDGRGAINPGDAVFVGAWGGSGSLLITGAGSRLDMPGAEPSILVGYGVSAGSYGPTQSQIGSVGSFGLMAGASAAAVYVEVGSYGGSGSLQIDGAGSQLQQAGVDALSGGTAFAIVGNQGGSGVATVSNGGLWLISDGGQDSRGQDKNNPGLELGKGGAGASASLSISGAGSTVRVVASSMNPVAGTVDNFNPLVVVGRDTGDTGELTISKGGQLLIVGNALSTPANPRLTLLQIGGDSTSFATQGTATVTGAGSQIVMSGNSDRIDLGRGPGSVGQLNVLDQGRVASTSLQVGAAGGTGVLLVDAATIALSGFRSDRGSQGAGATIGSDVGGNGSLLMSNGASFTITNNHASGGLSVGGDSNEPLGTGLVSLSGGSSIQLLGSVPGGIEIGRSGQGTMLLSGASTVNAGVGGTVLVGRLAGGSGLLNLSGNSTVTASYVGIGTNAPGVDAGGSGTLMLNHGTVGAALIENGSGGLITGEWGLLKGRVLNRGKIIPDPPAVPGTLTIDGSFQNSAGGSLVLDIASDGHGGFTTSHLVFTAGSSYDFTGMQISFDFLGNADPNAFVRSGAFRLDSFLLSQAVDGSTSGLSSSFAPGQSYSSWFTPAQFSAEADSYVISNFSLAPDGAATLSAAPVPEPASWLLALAGLCGLGMLRIRSRPIVVCKG